MKKKVNIIMQKQLELENLANKSMNALNLVTSTINNLSTINEEIETKVKEIREATEQLQLTENRLVDTKEHNTKIIEKFKTLIEG